MTKPQIVYRMRPLSGQDIPRLASWFENARDLSLFDRNSPIPIGPEALEAVWQENLETNMPRSSYWFAIDDPKGEVAGIGGLQNINYVHGDAVIPLFLSPKVRRSGIGLRATARLMDLAFDQLRLHRLTSYFRVDNLASQQLTAKLGFVVEGQIRSAWYCGGKHYDITMIGILSEEWAQARNTLVKKLGQGTVVVFGEDPVAY